MNVKNYLTSDIAAELGIARSTVADWLVRYADFLETETRGKRRYYTERSLEALKEIAELRNAGKNALEIEQVLTAHYGLKPEVALSRADDDAPAAGGETMNIPVLRPAFDQMAARINSEFEKITARLENAERERTRLSRRFRRIAAAWAAVLALTAGTAVWYSCRLYSGLRKADRNASEKLENSLAGMRALDERRGAELQDLNGRMDAAVKNRDSELNSLRKRLSENDQELNAVKSQRENDKKSGEETAAALREELKKQRAELLAELEKTRAESRTREQELRSQLADAAEKIRHDAHDELAARHQRELDNLIQEKSAVEQRLQDSGRRISELESELSKTGEQLRIEQRKRQDAELKTEIKPDNAGEIQL